MDLFQKAGLLSNSSECSDATTSDDLDPSDFKTASSSSFSSSSSSQNDLFRKISELIPTPTVVKSVATDGTATSTSSGASSADGSARGSDATPPPPPTPPREDKQIREALEEIRKRTFFVENNIKKLEKEASRMKTELEASQKGLVTQVESFKFMKDMVLTTIRQHAVSAAPITLEKTLTAVSKALAALDPNETLAAKRDELKKGIIEKKNAISKKTYYHNNLKNLLAVVQAGAKNPTVSKSKTFYESVHLTMKILNINTKNQGRRSRAPASPTRKGPRARAPAKAAAGAAKLNTKELIFSVHKDVMKLDEFVITSKQPEPKKLVGVWMSPMKKLEWIPKAKKPIHFISLSARGILCFGSRDSPTLHVTDMRTRRMAKLSVGHGAIGCEHEGALFVGAHSDMTMRHAPIEDVLAGAELHEFDSFPLPRAVGSSARFDMAHKGWILLDVDESPVERMVVHLGALSAKVVKSKLPLFSVGGATGVHLPSVQFFSKRGHDCFSVSKTGTISTLCRLSNNCPTVIPSSANPERLEKALFIDEQMNATYMGKAFQKLKNEHGAGQNIVRVYRDIFLFITKGGSWGTRRILVQ
eukprot:gnl/Chilomastix_cuspidata/3419.p1 GENE.gnl/Chilomastix_cuspidata/3419~~gnl/Chilomastix_cuspidata/3419.p1  ORF type:complete len:595 (+),score=187.24 gnl/Chilomastix_cuspidata/3419:25-1785(+)